jgi:hypothetical protein
MYVFSITDKSKKVFNFCGQYYRTPCRVIVNSQKEISQLHNILKQHDITGTTIENKIRNIPIRGVSGKSSLEVLTTTLKGGQPTVKAGSMKSMMKTSAATIIKF